MNVMLSDWFFDCRILHLQNEVSVSLENPDTSMTRLTGWTQVTGKTDFHLTVAMFIFSLFQSNVFVYLLRIQHY